MNDWAHLDSETKAVMGQGKSARIKYLKTTRWVPYARANSLLKEMAELIDAPKEERVTNLLVWGPPNNGKSMLAKKLVSRNPPESGFLEEKTRYPVLLINAPEGPDENRLYERILKAMHCPFKHSDSARIKRSQVESMFELLGVDTLAIDEMNQLLAGSGLKQEYILTVLKSMTNDMNIGIIGFGTRKALRVIQIDEQIESRFITRELELWQPDESFQRLLAGIEKTLPINNPSELSRPDIASTLYDLSDGLIGDLSMCIRQAARKAIESGKEVIDENLISSLNYRSSVARKRVRRA